MYYDFIRSCILKKKSNYMTSFNDLIEIYKTVK